MYAGKAPSTAPYSDPLQPWGPIHIVCRVCTLVLYIHTVLVQYLQNLLYLRTEYRTYLPTYIPFCHKRHRSTKRKEGKISPSIYVLPTGCQFKSAQLEFHDSGMEMRQSKSQVSIISLDFICLAKYIPTVRYSSTWIPVYTIIIAHAHAAPRLCPLPSVTMPYSSLVASDINPAILPPAKYKTNPP